MPTIMNKSNTHLLPIFFIFNRKDPIFAYDKIMASKATMYAVKVMECNRRQFIHHQPKIRIERTNYKSKMRTTFQYSDTIDSVLPVRTFGTWVKNL